jgi:hypothetical protein
LSEPWRIVIRPEGSNPGGTGDDEDPKNTGGLVVELVGAYGSNQEVSRVAWVRENSLHPDVPFEEMLEAVIHRARTAVVKINELFEDAGNLQ